MGLIVNLCYGMMLFLGLLGSGFKGSIIATDHNYITSW
jgi:hypothetical protein